MYVVTTFKLSANVKQTPALKLQCLALKHVIFLLGDYEKRSFVLKPKNNLQKSLSKLLIYYLLVSKIRLLSKIYILKRYRQSQKQSRSSDYDDDFWLIWYTQILDPIIHNIFVKYFQ